jgi:pimeloyl-ACP methyl ester carboxylesterase
VGPVLEPAGLAAIMSYVGVEPKSTTFEEAALALEATMGVAFPDLAPRQWEGFARTIYRDEGGRPQLSYDPRLREAVVAALESAPPDLWALFDAQAGLPILAIRGANSDLFSAATLTEMSRRRPDLAHVTIPNRGHVPFLDEPEALAAIDSFLDAHAR